MQEFMYIPRETGGVKYLGNNLFIQRNKSKEFNKIIYSFFKGSKLKDIFTIQGW